MPTNTVTMRPVKRDAGHSPVAMTRVTDTYGFFRSCRLTCECGKTFGSVRTPERVWQSHRAHLAATTEGA